MTTSLDTNVLAALWDKGEEVSSAAQPALDAALAGGGLVVSAPVYSELLALPRRDERFLEAFFADTGIRVDWNLGEHAWRLAGRAFQAYAVRRRRQRDAGPRRVLADFLIGAHALHKGYRLLTLDASFFRSAFADLEVVRF
jgi:hypothetical protein